MRERSVTIAKIESGIVIDHIPAGKAHLISQVLGLNALARETGDIIAIGVNFESPSLGKKDIIKVENLSLTRHMLNVVALIAPVATVTRIEKGAVIEKHKVEVPSQVGDIVICPDRFCITNHEEVPGKFMVVNQAPVTLRCNYCETEFFGPLIRYKEKK
jgi:aspartate carbamoyltransferase regulatory subunit